MQPYRPRPIRFLGVLERAGWRIKRYEITYDDATPDEARFAPGLRLALASLPSPAQTDGRPGASFLISHRGRTGDYMVLAWWDRENELPVRVFVRDRTATATWRPARGGESFCVWDLQVISFEREAYVRTVLGERGTAALDEYLAAGLRTDVPTTPPALDVSAAAGAAASPTSPLDAPAAASPPPDAPAAELEQHA